jgi:hypothetical protein
MIVSKVNTAPFFGRVCSICLLGSFVFVAVSAILQTAGNAQTADLALQTPQLAAAIESLQAQIDELRVQQTAMKLAGRNDERAPEYDPAHDAKNVSWLVQQPGAAGPGAAPSYPTARLTGFFQTDAVGFDQDAANIAGVGDGQSGADVRRAGRAAVGDVWDNVC